MNMNDREAMELALKEAQKGLGWVSLNPPVGCVILDRNGMFLSSGFHARYGGDHAEVNAINKIKDKSLLKGSSVYTTLEPCIHIGKTPSCAKSLREHSIRELYYGIKDPNPKVYGKGLRELQSSGVKIHKWIGFEKSLSKLYESFAWNQKYKKPFIAMKVASTLDGMTALVHGSSQWISSAYSRRSVSYLRGIYDSVAIGSGTFFQDRPQLNSRYQPFQKRENKVIIFDPSGRTLRYIPKSRIRTIRSPNNVIVCVGKGVSLPNKPDYRIHSFGLTPEGFDLDEVLHFLYDEEGIGSILLEGGNHTFSTFLNQREVQRIYQFINPSLLGGLQSKGFTESLNIPALDQKIALCSVEFKPSGRDILIQGRLQNPDVL